MRKPMFALLGLVIAFLGSQSWATARTLSSAAVLPTNCGGEEGQPPCSITNTFSPGTTRGVYDFGNDGRLVVNFNTVLTTFTLTVTLNNTISPIDFEVFPEGTMCVPYESSGQCTQYDFTGDAHGPHGVPVRKIDYRGLISLTLSYLTSQTVHDPAFGHAPGDTTTFTEDILTSYSIFPCSECDPTMDGSTPGLSSVVALDKPLAENDTFCLVSPHDGDKFPVGKEIEVAFRLVASGASCDSGTPIRDKTARLSLSTTDSSGNVIFRRIRNKEEGNKFHFDHEDGVNEADLSTHRLAPGSYTITIWGSKFSPQSVDIMVVPGTDTDDACGEDLDRP